MRKFIIIIMALVAMNVTDAEAKKFYHYGNTLTFLCDDETMTAEVAGTYHVETSGTITVPETFVAKDGNTYTVTAIGDDFLYFHDFSYSQNCSEVVLPKTIKSIGKRAFGYSNIQRINLPEGLETIDDEAFRDCSSLELAELPSTVKHLGNKAFDRCGSITISALPESIETLGSSVFGGLLRPREMVSFSLPDNLTEIPDSMFHDRWGMKELHFPANLKKIGKACVTWSNITELNLPDGVTEIAEEAFYGNKKLTKVTLPKSIKSIPYFAFAYTGLDNLDFLHEGITEIGIEAFYGSKIKEANIPEGVTKVGSNAFGYCDSLKTIRIPSTLTEMYDSPCEELHFLDSIIIADGNPAIEMTADKVLTCKNKDGRSLLFVGPDAIVDSTYILPADITEIGDFALEYAGINRFEFPEGLRRIGNLNFCESKIKKVILPSTLEELGGGLFISSELEEIKLPSGLRFIPNQIFAYCSKLKKVEWPEEVEAIGAYAFANTPLMTEVEIPQTVKLIGASAFANHYSPYERVVLPEGLETIGESAFSESPLPNGIVIPGSVRWIGAKAFFSCGIKDIVIPEGVEYVGDNCFEGNSAISLKLPSTLKYIGQQAFRNNDFETMELPDVEVTIEPEAFRECNSLREVSIPRSANISSYTFHFCSALEKATFPKDLQVIHSGQFAGCTSLKSVTLPENLIALENEIFDGCSALEEIDFPETLECIGNWVFRGTSLKKADLSHTSLRNIIWEAFADNASLTEVRLPATCNFVGAKAFAGCDNICVVEVLATEPPTAEAEAFQSPVTEQATLIVPEGSEQAYRNAEVWKEFKNIATPTSLRTTIVDSQEDERIYDLRGIEKQSEKGLVIKNGIKVIKN